MNKTKTKKQPNFVKKPLGSRCVELIQALKIVQSSLEGIKEGKRECSITLSGQLRALLTEKSSRNKPLLLDLAQQFDVPLDIYSMPDTQDVGFPAELREKVMFHLSGFPVSLVRILPKQNTLKFETFLNEKIINLKGKLYTPADIINHYANNAGGAHYSDNLTEDIYNLLNFSSLELQPLTHALLQIGEVTLTIGKNILKKLVDFELHLILAIPDYQKPQNACYILDCNYAGTFMQYSIAVDNLLKPIFYVRGHQGIQAKISSEELIDWKKPRYLSVSHHINDNFQSVLSMKIDGKSHGTTKVDEPLFVASDPLHYDCHYNKSYSGEKQDFIFALGELVQLGESKSPSDTANLFLYFERKVNTSDIALISYNKQSFGISARGTKDIKMTGEVTKVSDINQFLNLSEND